jgi:O-antigen ligase
MTSLRYGKIGVAEVCLFIWSLINIIKKRFRIKSDQYVMFWLLFDLCLIVGFFIRVMNSFISGPYIEESLTYIYFTLFVISLSQYFQNASIEQLLVIMKRVFFWAFYIYSSIYLYSILFGKTTIFGFSLWYSSERLSMLANNPHQFVYLIGPLIFVGFFFLRSNYMQNKLERVLCYLAIISFIVMCLQSKSSTFLAVSVVIAGYLLLFNTKSTIDVRKKNLLNGIKVLFTFSIIIMSYSMIHDLFIKFVESDRNGLERFTLWQLGIEKIKISPIFGLGPGSHLFLPEISVYMEAHNTYLDVALRSGIVGLILYLIILIRTIKVTKVNIYATCTVLFFCLYGIAGFSLRRITLWFLIMGMYYICVKMINTHHKNKIIINDNNQIKLLRFSQFSN